MYKSAGYNNISFMSTTQKYISEIRRILWPIEWHENRKFLPMAAMMFCILLNYSTLRSIKDGFVVTSIGAEAISFLKTYIVLPSAVLSMIIYVKLCDLLNSKKVFYTITSFFILYFIIFAFVLYPNPDFFHPNSKTIETLSNQLPNFKWFIRIIGKWSLASFYTMSELWGSVMLSLLFWQFANEITKIEEAKRFYSMFGMIANLALPVTAVIISYFLSDATQLVSEKIKFLPLLCVIVVSGLIVLFLYRWMHTNVLLNKNILASEKKAPKEKVRLSLVESFKMIFTSRYIGLIAVLVLAYGISTNLVEGVWKSKIQQLYTTSQEYTMFMGKFQAYQGVTAIIFMIIGSNILRSVSWITAAMLTPLMMLVTGIVFFIFIFFDNTIAMYLTGIFSSGPLVMVVIIGAVQQILAKSTKYSLFDATKNMAYIPLDKELKTKGQAAVEVIGGRFGKSGGGVIQSTFFMLFPTFSFVEATPYFAGIFFVIVILWLYAIRALNKEYTNTMVDHSY